MLSLPARLQAPVLSAFSGVEVSVSTANRIAREYRESRGEATAGAGWGQGWGQTGQHQMQLDATTRES
jgi:hypothetical protein